MQDSPRWLDLLIIYVCVIGISVVLLFVAGIWAAAFAAAFCSFVFWLQRRHLDRAKRQRQRRRGNGQS